MLTDEGYKSNYLVFNRKKNSDGKFELLQSHLVEKIINSVVLTESASLKSRETHSGKPLLDKDESSRKRKFVWNYTAAVSMLSYLQ